MATQPNILMIQADQLSALALGCYGHPVAITPALDELAASGVLFENAYCNSPLCGPSRNSMVSGRHPFKIGSYDNSNELPAAVPTFVHVLRGAGYETWMSGKMHYVGPDQLHGLHGRVTTDIYPSGFGWTPDWSRGAYGNAGTSVRYLHQSGTCAWGLQLDYDEETANRGLRCLRDLVRDCTPAGRPFFLCVSFTHPHDPFVITDDYWDLYDGVEIPPPSVPAYPLEDMHPFDRWIQIHHEADRYPPSVDTIQRARRAYLAMTSYIDRKVADFMAELKRLGVDENTVVVFTSDHGDMQGEHGMWYKRTYREWAMRVPLIVRLPPGAGGAGRGSRVSSPVSLVDLFPTLTDLAGAPGDWPGAAALDGASLAPFVRGQMSEWDRPVLAEYCGEGTVQPMRMVREGNRKYVSVNGEAPLLFDLETDPSEQVNLAGRDSVSEVEQKLAATAKSGWDAPALREAIVADQGQRMFLNKVLSEGRGTSWDYQPVQNAENQYVRPGNSTQGTKRKFRWPFVPPVDAR